MLAYHREKVNLTMILFLFVMFALCFTERIHCLLEYLGSFLLKEHCLLSVLTGGPTLHMCPKCEMTEENSDTSYKCFFLPSSSAWTPVSRKNWVLTKRILTLAYLVCGLLSFSTSSLSHATNCSHDLDKSFFVAFSASFRPQSAGVLCVVWTLGVYIPENLTPVFFWNPEILKTE